MISDNAWSRIVILGAEGFSARCIQAQIKRHDSERVSRSTIYRVCAGEGISLWDYRNGANKRAKIHLAHLSQPRQLSKAV